MVDLQRLDHIAIAVDSLEPAARLFLDIFGAEFIHGGDDDRLGIRTVQLRLPPGVKVELMTPTRDDSYLRRFIDKHGQGFHHMTLIVDDVLGAAGELTAAGWPVVDTDVSRTQWKETFIRPSAGLGLVQLAQTGKSWANPATEYTLQDVIAGRVVWRDSQARLRPGMTSAGQG